MEIDNLVKMANQIGRFFDAWPDRAVARAEVAEHLKRFWNPRMCEALLDHVAGGAPDGLMPLVAEAVSTLARDRPAADRRAPT